MAWPPVVPVGPSQYGEPLQYLTKGLTTVSLTSPTTLVACQGENRLMKRVVVTYVAAQNSSN